MVRGLEVYVWPWDRIQRAGEDSAEGEAGLAPALTVGREGAEVGPVPGQRGWE